VHVKPAIGGVQLQKLDAAHLNRLYGQLSEKLSVRTVRYIHTIAHRAFRDAMKWGRIVRNPADAADPPRAKDARPPEMRTWTGAELSRFFALVESSRYRTPWLVLATTGMRRGEVLGLRWRDLDLEGGRLSIRQTVTLVDHAIVIANRTKTGKGRAVDLDATTIAELRAHRVKHAQELLLLGIRADGDTLVFCHPDARPYNPERFSREFARALERHPEVPHIRLHDLRHTWATLALTAGVPVKIVSERLGHSTTAITSDTYSHVTPTMGADAAEKVAGLISGSL
jgi:integrase